MPNVTRTWRARRLFSVAVGAVGAASLATLSLATASLPAAATDGPATRPEAVVEQDVEQRVVDLGEELFDDPHDDMGESLAHPEVIGASAPAAPCGPRGTSR